MGKILVSVLTRDEHRFFRTTGTAATIAQFLWKYAHYPKSYPRVARPLTLFLFASCTTIDLIYPFVYMAVKGKDGGR